jgi:hypothetical protein
MDYVLQPSTQTSAKTPRTKNNNASVIRTVGLLDRAAVPVKREVEVPYSLLVAGVVIVSGQEAAAFYKPTPRLQRVLIGRRQGCTDQAAEVIRDDRQIVTR